ncbi:MAG TPA: hypothetical protein PLC05_02635 [bacterium]|nr:hypothetical protein [bacterium]HOR57203.1 hypothetical protein [bacterium]HPL56376.1 hypothetical protein [bacterium]
MNKRNTKAKPARKAPIAKAGKRAGRRATGRPSTPRQIVGEVDLQGRDPLESAKIVWGALEGAPLNERFTAAVKAAEEVYLARGGEMTAARAYKAAIETTTEALLVRAS